MTEKRQTVSLVCPVFNEADNIQIFYDEVCRELDGADVDVELLFVNDGSRDASLTILRQITDRDERVRVVSFSRNFGSMAALTCGLEQATGDAAIVMSVDLQDPPSLIPKLIEAWRKGPDMVWAVREARDDPWSMRMFAGAFYWFIRKFVFSDYPKYGMDVGLFSRRVIDIFRVLPERNSSPIFTLYGLGFEHARIPYKRRARARGESGWSFWRRLKIAIDILTGVTYLPLRLIGVFGFATSAGAFLYGSLIVVRKLVFDLGGEGWPSLAVLVLFLGGIQLLFLGVLAEYVWRISEQSRLRPRYIVSQSFGRAADGDEKSKPAPLNPDNLDVSSR